MKYVLIDANIYLGFYRFSSDELVELEKLVELAKTDELVVYSCQQVEDEIARNRGKVISDALAEFKKTLPGANYPQMVRSYPRHRKLVEARSNLVYEHDKIVDLITSDATRRALPADRVISALLKSAEKMATGEAAVEAARDRSMRRNPPGKAGSYGDALIWESLMAHHSMRAGTVHLISGDDDYSSDLQRDELHEMLVDDAKRRMPDGAVVLHKRLSGFLRRHYPDIEVAAEAEADVAVSRLERSGAFASTHSAIAALGDFSDFSPAHVRRLANAALENDQITMILGDEDVHDFYRQLLERHADDLEQPQRDALTARLTDAEEDDDW